MISGQTFEHVEFFWLSLPEMVRVVRPGGLICIVAPSRGPEHRYPVDCWRFYPDGFHGLGRYAGLEALQAETQWDSLGYGDSSDDWGDTIAVFRRPHRLARRPRARLALSRLIGWTLGN